MEVIPLGTHYILSFENAVPCKCSLVLFVMGVAGGWGIPEVSEYRLQRNEQIRALAWSYCLGDECLLGSCPETVGVGGKAEALSCQSGF